MTLGLGAASRPSEGQRGCHFDGQPLQGLGEDFVEDGPPTTSTEITTSKESSWDVFFFVYTCYKQQDMIEHLS